MSSRPTILLAGDSNLYLLLLDHFPPAATSLVNAASMTEALDLAVDAAIVVVDDQLRGGGVELCRRLRSDPITGHTPLVLCVNKESEGVQAITDARVLKSDVALLVRTIHRLCPELSGTPPGQSGHESPGLGNKMSPATGPRLAAQPRGTIDEWLPPPPQLEPGQDLTDLTQQYTSYLKTLCQALEAPSRLSAEQLDRLEQMTHLSLSEVDKLLISLQQSVNDALMTKNLDRMKILTTAKNNLYERLQRIRTLLGKLEGMKSSGELTPPPPLPPQKATAKKSELTKAAEAKKAETVATQRAERPQPRGPAPKPAYAAQPSARKVSSGDVPRRLLFPVVIVLLLASVVIVIYLRSGRKQTAAPQSGSPAPSLQRVLIEQAPTGILVRPQAAVRPGERITYKIRWRVNGQLIEGARTARLAPEHYQIGSVVQAEVAASSGLNAGQSMISSKLEVKASAPRPPVPAPSPKTVERR